MVIANSGARTTPGRCCWSTSRKAGGAIQPFKGDQAIAPTFRYGGLGKPLAWSGGVVRHGSRGGQAEFAAAPLTPQSSGLAPRLAYGIPRACKRTLNGPNDTELSESEITEQT